MELNREQIIKALECWIKNFDGKVTDFKTLTESALLIKKLTEENERLKEFSSSKCADCAGCTSWKCDCANIEAQAKFDIVRKMQERLLKELRTGNIIMDKSIADIINRITQEILEGKNDK